MRAVEGEQLNISGPTWVGAAFIITFFVAFGGWAAVAELESAAIAFGVVTVESERKTVQHLEGGIVAELHVREGDRVSRGDVLLRIDRTQAEAQAEFVRSRYLASLGLEARLIAERDGAAEIAFPGELTTRIDDPAVQAIVQSQQDALTNRRELLERRIEILQQGIAEYREELKGLEGQIAAYDEQLESFGEEESGINELAAQGLVPRTQLLDLERRGAEIEGARSQAVARMSQLRQSITESELQINELVTSNLTSIVEDLRDVQGDVFELRERLRAAEDVLARTDVLAPIDGTVVGLSTHTTGGVIASGAPLMDIVPSDDVLIVEARLDPADIDVVQIGLPAQVRLTALNQRDVPPVDGAVIALSADAFEDELTGARYFDCKIALDDASLTAALTGTGATLVPGMQAEVLVLTGARTPLDYFLEPLTRSMNRAMREH
jgi:HlyD family type I secretion membrane fusion protein